MNLPAVTSGHMLCSTCVLPVGAVEYISRNVLVVGSTNHIVLLFLLGCLLVDSTNDCSGTLVLSTTSSQSRLTSVSPIVLICRCHLIKLSMKYEFRNPYSVARLKIFLIVSLTIWSSIYCCDSSLSYRLSLFCFFFSSCVFARGNGL